MLLTESRELLYLNFKKLVLKKKIRIKRNFKITNVIFNRIKLRNV